MYDSPPPEGSLDWSLGLLIDVCMRIGLGSSKAGGFKWSESQLTQELNVGSIRGWKTGGGIREENLNRLVEVLTAGEEYSAEWELVIRNSAKKIVGTEAIKKQRSQYFGVERFNLKNQKVSISDYLESSDALLLSEVENRLKRNRPTPKQQIQRSYKSKKSSRFLHKYFLTLAIMTFGILAMLFVVLTTPWSPDQINTNLSDSIYADIEYKGVVFENIQFCEEVNFDHELNKCLVEQDTFNSQTQRKVNISFESDKIRSGDVINLRWYRYGEMFIESEKNWTDAFAFQYKYASTFIGFNENQWSKGKKLDKGRYHVRFYIKNNLIDEASFTVQ